MYIGRKIIEEFVPDCLTFQPKHLDINVLIIVMLLVFSNDKVQFFPPILEQDYKRWLSFFKAGIGHAVRAAVHYHLVLVQCVASEHTSALNNANFQRVCHISVEE